MAEEEKKFVEIPKEEVPKEIPLEGGKEGYGSEDNPFIFDFVNKRIRKVPTIQTYGVDIPQSATKGDLTIGDGSYSQRLAVGSNNQGLIADSVQSLGIKWADIVNSIVAGTNITVSGATGNVTISASFLKFGGTGADGALAITSGTTTLNAGGAAFYVKNYTSISITGTGSLAFSNPHANGTIVILKSQGNVTITSNANPTIDLRSMGSAGGAGGAMDNSGVGSNTVGSTIFTVGGSNGGGAGVGGFNGAGGTASTALNYPSPNIMGKMVIICSGVGGGGGGGGRFIVQSTGVGGAGGNGGGGFYMECGGALNISSIFNSSGANGVVGGGGNQSGSGGGGGGGGAGTIVIVYNTLTANSATFTVSKGAGQIGGNGNAIESGGGGAGGSSFNTTASNGTNGVAGLGGTGGNGADSYSLVVQNTEFA